MSMTMPFPEFLYALKSITYEFSTVDKMWIKQEERGMFSSLGGDHSVSFKIAPVSVATQILLASGAAMTALCATAR